MVKIHGDWNGLSCKVCARYEEDETSDKGMCDSEGEQYENNLCKLFKPQGLSPKLDEIWEFCQKRWVLGIMEEWVEIACKFCRRYNADGICDFKGKQKEDKFCKLFIPKRLPFELGQIWGFYQQRWIIEQQS